MHINKCRICGEKCRLVGWIYSQILKYFARLKILIIQMCYIIINTEQVITVIQRVIFLQLRTSSVNIHTAGRQQRGKTSLRDITEKKLRMTVFRQLINTTLMASYNIFGMSTIFENVLKNLKH